MFGWDNSGQILVRSAEMKNSTEKLLSDGTEKLVGQNFFAI